MTRGTQAQRRRNRILGGTLALLLLASLELGSRVYLSLATGAPLSRPADVLYAFYPELERIQRQEIQRNSRDFDVLLLGASVLNRHWGTFEPAFREVLQLHTRRQIRLWNASAPGHSSLDSLYKYRHLEAQRFELVVLYQAINELRANCAPDDVFRPDYSHMEWYRRLNWVERHRGLLRWTSLPYTAHDAWMELQKLTGRYRPIPFDTVDPRLLEYGEKLKTPPSFQRNVEAIATLAHERNDPLLLMTYAWYLPEGYTHQRFEKRIAGYTGHAVSVETWGGADAVRAGLSAHNAAIRKVAGAHPEALFLDQAALMPAQREYWNDICHPTSRGMVEFADGIGRRLEEGGVFQEAGRRGG